MNATDTMRAIPVRITPEMVRDYQRCIDPIIQQMVLIESLRSISFLIHSDGQMEHVRSAELEALIDQCNARIEHVRKSIFGEAV